MSETMTAKEYLQHVSSSMSEDEHQIRLFQWIDEEKHSRPALENAFHPPNGGARDARTGARMKALGTRPGVPDFCLIAMRARPYGGLYGALWIEMKSSTGRLRERQREWRERILNAGHAWALCRSWQEARDVILTYLDDAHTNDPQP